jgi:AraC-like DNA-binding protein
MKKYRVETEREIIKNTGVEFFYHNRTNSKVSGIPHLHSAVELLFIKKGKFQIFVNDMLYKAEKDDVVLIRSNTPHIIITDTDEDAGYYVFKFSPEFLSGLSSAQQSSRYLLALSMNLENSKTVWRENESKTLFEALYRLISESKGHKTGADIGMRIAAAEVVLQLIRSLEKTEVNGWRVDIGNDTVERIYEATLYIDKHYAEQLRVDECASSACMSYSYFSRCFSQITGKSFKEYLNSVRINHAERELYSTDKPITEIALDNGFNDASYFISVYRSIKGITPSAARLVRRKTQENLV